MDKIFLKMFPDSYIARAFSCGASKCAYIVNHGLAPYFRSQLLQQIRGLDSFVLLFDESLNKYTQNKQMDLHIRFFDDSVNEVVTRYYTSHFMGHAYADTMIDAFIEICQDLNLTKLIQLSMDGPAVNWSFYEKFVSKIETNTSDKRLIDI